MTLPIDRDCWWTIHDASIREALNDVESGLTPEQAYAKLNEWATTESHKETAHG